MGRIPQMRFPRRGGEKGGTSHKGIGRPKNPVYNGARVRPPPEIPHRPSVTSAARKKQKWVFLPKKRQRLLTPISGRFFGRQHPVFELLRGIGVFARSPIYVRSFRFQTPPFTCHGPATKAATLKKLLRLWTADVSTKPAGGKRFSRKLAGLMVELTEKNWGDAREFLIIGQTEHCWRWAVPEWGSRSCRRLLLGGGGEKTSSFPAFGFTSGGPSGGGGGGGRLGLGLVVGPWPSLPHAIGDGKTALGDASGARRFRLGLTRAGQRSDVDQRAVHES